ncbi:unnamed protein product [Nippostrongylus brasiliensis]|uniref:BPTI/Kunitz inhibitor domain-containing protein n=1 Tax=Nippostrongylus brasiliensis TaxID=27835 RepID=A0A0N4XJ16_NIPBR|nr:unnamed protein product [Nippostrongylus brasiliensis]
MTCLAFRFTGCGGNSNNFPTRSKCYETCMPMDYFNCPANRPEVKQADGSIIICRDKTNCPEGSQCDYGAFFGICCDKKDHGRNHCTSVKHTASFDNANLATTVPDAPQR